MFTYMTWVTLRATFEARKSGNLPPYLGSTVRGLLGHSLRRMVCLTPKVRCSTCALAEDCAFTKYFTSPGNPAGSVNPFVLHVLTTGKTNWQTGDICEFEITLFGQASQRMELIVEMLRRIEQFGWGSERIPFTLLKITNPSTQKLVYYNKKKWIENAVRHPLDCMEQQASHAFIQFAVPLRLEKSKQLITEPSFEDIIRATTRRISLLSHAYAGHQLEWDEEEMLAEAREIKTNKAQWQADEFRRYSMNQKNNELKMETITGWACYEGDITPFTPLLQAGQILHIGRNPTHGFGRYTIDYN
ncbi:CRISPR system precrRNA processing endoribonuclease RAMP protein Cas6 [Metasolibacillus meyeri]|uniref:CRISPR system precrRNA processing endoribonuclease RAMP protein Cas6 n=1 Tax=Metasolibacillus meyeri TaxID=1071052 RepID=UPI000D2F656F|nr:CRISPR system precrRNA processing endoribonuclease RAMP protein Cas6 [Metasolibacillus meyeri]